MGRVQGYKIFGDITGWDIDTYAMYRRDQGLETITLNKELGTVKNFLEYCSRIELVDGDVPEKVDIPKVPHQKNVSEKLLSVKRANMLFRFYDQSEKQYSTEHALLVIEWFNGSRLGGIRGLDIGSYTPSNKSEYEEGYLEYRHRPEIGLPLKNDYDGERIVGLPEYADNVVGSYVDENRKESYDENGFRPLITTSTGRASVGTIRAWTYLATEPCLHTDCPHGTPEISAHLLIIVMGVSVHRLAVLIKSEQDQSHGNSTRASLLIESQRGSTHPREF